MNTCLLVIDVQQSFLHRSYYSADGMAAYLACQNALIGEARRRGWPIVRVFHHEPGEGEQQPFSLLSGLVRPMEGLSGFDPDLTVHKTRHSALVGTGLDVWLVAQGIRRLVISGIRTEQCCETTARHASDLGWQVDFVADATMTWPIDLPGGGQLSVAAIRERTAAALHDRFARVLSLDALIQEPHHADAEAEPAV